MLTDIDALQTSPALDKTRRLCGELLGSGYNVLTRRLDELIPLSSHHRITSARHRGNKIISLSDPPQSQPDSGSELFLLFTLIDDISSVSRFAQTCSWWIEDVCFHWHEWWCRCLSFLSLLATWQLMSPVYRSSAKYFLLTYLCCFRYILFFLGGWYSSDVSLLTTGHLQIFISLFGHESSARTGNQTRRLWGTCSPRMMIADPPESGSDRERSTCQDTAHCRCQHLQFIHINTRTHISQRDWDRHFNIKCVLFSSQRFSSVQIDLHNYITAIHSSYSVLLQCFARTETYTLVATVNFRFSHTIARK